MDTLSRKHRLRQQQQRRVEQQQQQQMLYLGKENQQDFQACEEYHFDHFQSSNSTNHNRNYGDFNHQNNNTISSSNNNNSEDDDEEQFKVFSLSANGQHQFEGVLEEPSTSETTRASVLKCRKSNSTNRKRAIENHAEHVDELYEEVVEVADDEEEEEMVRKEVLSSILHYMPTQNVANNANKQQVAANQYTRGSFYGDCSTGSCSTNTTTTSKSTGGHSSGFMSAEESSSSGQVNLAAYKQRQRDNHYDRPRRHLHERQKRDRAALARSKVIDDLDRLMADASECRSNSRSPADSCLSCSDSTLIPLNDSKLANGNELDYSTLCRDEFSSFIAVEAAQNNSNRSHQKTRPTMKKESANLLREVDATSRCSKPLVVSGETHSGPMLVGVHDSNNNANNPPRFIPRFGHPNNNLTLSSRDSSSSPIRSDLSESQHEFRSSPSTSSELSTSAASNTSISATSGQQQIQHQLVESPNSLLDDDEFVVLEERFNYENQQQKDSFYDLNGMLDNYLDKIQCLLRLTSGDKSVSMEEAFDNYELNISEENRTKIEYKLVERGLSSIKVVQEMRIVEEELNDDEIMLDSSFENNRCQILTASFGSKEYKSLLSSMQTSATLNWPPRADLHSIHSDGLSITEPTVQANEQKLVESRRLLEKSLIKSLISCPDQSKQLGALNKRELGELIEVIKQHVSEFIDTYNAYQSELKAQTSFANDWHQNWLFAYKRSHFEENTNCQDYDNNLSATKKAKLSYQSGFNLEQDKIINLVSKDEQQPIDLLKYSTLILNRCTPIKLTYLTANSNECDYSLNIERLYEAQQDAYSELYSQSLESKGKLDGIRLLLCDINDEELDADERGDRSRSFAKRHLLINYDSSSMRPYCARYLSFSAYGYLFEVPKVRPTIACDSFRLARLKEKILAKLKKLLNEQQSSNSQTDNGETYCCSQDVPTGVLNERVRFLVNLTNVELVNKLPVIQFCAKVSGARPISVRWFKSDSEVSNPDAVRSKVRQPIRVSDELGRQVKRSTDCESSWPIEMYADYDYEYQNECSSWYRFRRHQDDILFEIRDANLKEDYNKTYKCVITNYCSTEECCFSLTQRQLDEDRLEKSPEREPNRKKSAKADGHALLRTWSQRTLHKPVPIEQQVSAGSSAEVVTSGNRLETDCSNNSWQQSIGRCSTLARSRGQSEKDDKFGKNFPYHPENLLKRLEENKFSTLLKSRRLDGTDNSSHNYDQSAACPAKSSTNVPQTEFPDCFEPLTEETVRASTTTTTTTGSSQNVQQQLLQQQRMVTSAMRPATNAKQVEDFQVCQAANGKDVERTTQLAPKSQEVKAEVGHQNSQPMPRLSRKLKQPVVGDCYESVLPSEQEVSSRSNGQRNSSSSRLTERQSQLQSASKPASDKSMEAQQQVASARLVASECCPAPLEIECKQLQADLDRAAENNKTAKGESVKWPPKTVKDNNVTSNGPKVNVKFLISRFSAD